MSRLLGCAVHHQTGCFPRLQMGQLLRRAPAADAQADLAADFHARFRFSGEAFPAAAAAARHTVHRAASQRADNTGANVTPNPSSTARPPQEAGSHSAARAGSEDTSASADAPLGVRPSGSSAKTGIYGQWAEEPQGQQQEPPQDQRSDSGQPEGVSVQSAAPAHGAGLQEALFPAPKPAAEGAGAEPEPASATADAEGVAPCEQDSPGAAGVASAGAASDAAQGEGADGEEPASRGGDASAAAAQKRPAPLLDADMDDAPAGQQHAGSAQPPADPAHEEEPDQATGGVRARMEAALGPPPTREVGRSGDGATGDNQWVNGKSMQEEAAAPPPSPPPQQQQQWPGGTEPAPGPGAGGWP